MDHELSLRIVVEGPPEGVDYGVQKGRGRLYETVQTQRSSGKNLTFLFKVELKAAGKATAADMAGPFVQGPKGQRFIYLDIGAAAGQMHSHWSRRLKIPLTGITPEMIAEAGILEARVPGTGRDGGPTCASVKDFEGWKVKRR